MTAPSNSTGEVYAQATARGRLRFARRRPWPNRNSRAIGLRNGAQLERDLPELLAFFAFPWHLWRKLRTTSTFDWNGKPTPSACLHKRLDDAIIRSGFDNWTSCVLGISAPVSQPASLLNKL